MPVNRIAALHVADLDQRIEELTAMKRTLQTLVDCCHGDHRPDCPILDELGQDAEGRRVASCKVLRPTGMTAITASG